MCKNKGCHKEVATVFEWDQNNDPLDQTILSDTNSFDIERLDIISHFIRLDIPLEEAKNGWFTSTRNLGSGYDILKWVWDQVEADEDKASVLCK